MSLLFAVEVEAYWISLVSAMGLNRVCPYSGSGNEGVEMRKGALAGSFVLLLQLGSNQ